MSLTDFLPLGLAALSGIALLVYLLLDGRDLGAGILYPLVARRTDAALLIRSAAPFWDANEVWLLLSGVSALVGFPAVANALAPHIQTPLLLMAGGMALRALGYHFQARSDVLQRLWNVVFASGSVFVALCQGWMFGRVVAGVPPVRTDAVISMIAWDLCPLVGSVAAVGLYGLLACGWLVARTRGALQVLGREVAVSAALLTIALMFLLCALRLIAHASEDDPSRGTIAVLVTGVLATSTAIFGWLLQSSLWKDQASTPLLWAKCLATTAVAAVTTQAYALVWPHLHTSCNAQGESACLERTLNEVIVVAFLACIQLAFALRASNKGAVPDEDSPGVSKPHIGARRTSAQDTDLHLS